MKKIHFVISSIIVSLCGSCRTWITLSVGSLFCFFLTHDEILHLLFVVHTSSRRGQLGKYSNDVSMETRQGSHVSYHSTQEKPSAQFLLRFWNDVRTNQNQRAAQLLLSRISEIENVSDVFLLSYQFVSCIFLNTFTDQEAITVMRENSIY